MLREMNQTQKDKYHMAPLAGGPQNTQVHQDREHGGGHRGPRAGKGVATSRVQSSVQGD